MNTEDVQEAVEANDSNMTLTQPTSNVPDNPIPREHLISTAVKFLQSSVVVSSSLRDKQEFLRKKGLTDIEISEALIRAQNTIEARHPDGPEEQVLSHSGNVLVLNLESIKHIKQLSRVINAALVSSNSGNRFRNWSVFVALFGGALYGCYRLYKEYIIPFLTEEKSSTQTLNGRLAENTEALSAFSEQIEQLQQSCEKNSQKIDRLQTSANANHGIEIKELKDELSSLKRLLLSRHQFPDTPTVKPVIPAWQLDAARQSETVTVPATNSDNSDSPNSADSPAEGTQSNPEEHRLDQNKASDSDTESMAEQADAAQTATVNGSHLDQSAMINGSHLEQETTGSSTSPLKLGEVGSGGQPLQSVVNRTHRNLPTSPFHLKSDSNSQMQRDPEYPAQRCPFSQCYISNRDHSSIQHYFSHYADSLGAAPYMDSCIPQFSPWIRLHQPRSTVTSDSHVGWPTESRHYNFESVTLPSMPVTAASMPDMSKLVNIFGAHQPLQLETTATVTDRYPLQPTYSVEPDNVVGNVQFPMHVHSDIYYDATEAIPFGKEPFVGNAFDQNVKDELTEEISSFDTSISTLTPCPSPFNALVIDHLPSISISGEPRIPLVDKGVDMLPYSTEVNTILIHVSTQTYPNVYVNKYVATYSVSESQSRDSRTQIYPEGSYTPTSTNSVEIQVSTELCFPASDHAQCGTSLATSRTSSKLTTEITYILTNAVDIECFAETCEFIPPVCYKHVTEVLHLTDTLEICSLRLHSYDWQMISPPEPKNGMYQTATGVAQTCTPEPTVTYKVDAQTCTPEPTVTYKVDVTEFQHSLESVSRHLPPTLCFVTSDIVDILCEFKIVPAQQIFSKPRQVDAEGLVNFHDPLPCEECNILLSLPSNFSTIVSVLPTINVIVWPLMGPQVQPPCPLLYFNPKIVVPKTNQVTQEVCSTSSHAVQTGTIDEINKKVSSSIAVVLPNIAQPKQMEVSNQYVTSVPLCQTADLPLVRHQAAAKEFDIVTSDAASQTLNHLPCTTNEKGTQVIETLGCCVSSQTNTVTYQNAYTHYGGGRFSTSTQTCTVNADITIPQQVDSDVYVLASEPSETVQQFTASIFSDKCFQTTLLAVGNDHSYSIAQQIDQSRSIAQQTGQSCSIAQQTDQSCSIAQQTYQSRSIAQQTDQSRSIAQQADQSCFIAQQTDRSHSIALQTGCILFMNRRIQTQQEQNVYHDLYWNDASTQTTLLDQYHTVANRADQTNCIIYKNIFVQSSMSASSISTYTDPIMCNSLPTQTELHHNPQSQSVQTTSYPVYDELTHTIGSSDQSLYCLAPENHIQFSNSMSQTDGAVSCRHFTMATSNLTDDCISSPDYVNIDLPMSGIRANDKVKSRHVLKSSDVDTAQPNSYDILDSALMVDVSKPLSEKKASICDDNEAGQVNVGTSTESVPSLLPLHFGVAADRASFGVQTDDIIVATNTSSVNTDSVAEVDNMGCQTVVHIPWSGAEVRNNRTVPYFANVHGIAKSTFTVDKAFSNIGVSTFIQTTNEGTFMDRANISDKTTDMDGQVFEAVDQTKNESSSCRYNTSTQTKAVAISIDNKNAETLPGGKLQMASAELDSIQMAHQLPMKLEMLDKSTSYTQVAMDRAIKHNPNNNLVDSIQSFQLDKKTTGNKDGSLFSMLFSKFTDISTHVGIRQSASDSGIWNRNIFPSTSIHSSQPSHIANLAKKQSNGSSQLFQSAFEFLITDRGTQTDNDETTDIKLGEKKETEEEIDINLAWEIVESAVTAADNDEINLSNPRSLLHTIKEESLSDFMGIEAASLNSLAKFNHPTGFIPTGSKSGHMVHEMERSTGLVIKSHSEGHIEPTSMPTPQKSFTIRPIKRRDDLSYISSELLDFPTIKANDFNLQKLKPATHSLESHPDGDKLGNQNQEFQKASPFNADVTTRNPTMPVAAVRATFNESSPCTSLSISDSSCSEGTLTNLTDMLDFMTTVSSHSTADTLEAVLSQSVSDLLDSESDSTIT